jgi:hypothetical protein
VLSVRHGPMKVPSGGLQPPALLAEVWLGERRPRLVGYSVLEAVAEVSSAVLPQLRLEAERLLLVSSGRSTRTCQTRLVAEDSVPAGS